MKRFRPRSTPKKGQLSREAVVSRSIKDGVAFEVKRPLKSRENYVVAARKDLVTGG